MLRYLKRLHYIALSLGLLSAAAVILNLVIFSILYPQVTRLLESQPSWETYGIVAAVNIIVIALFQLSAVAALLIHMVARKKTSVLVVAAVATGIISGLMVLGDISLLSDIGSEYEMGWQTRGEWLILFVSYGLHILSLALGLISLARNLNQDHPTAESAIKDEVLFSSLLTTGLICGILGLIGVAGGLFSSLSLWMMQRIVPILSLLTLSPFLVLLLIWLSRRKLGEVSPELDEKQFQDLASAGLWTLIICLPLMVLFFILQLSPAAGEGWSVLWLPLLLFLCLGLFSSLSLHKFSS